ncbi:MULTISPECIES: helix-turn-helix transcriptional regulator [unclassified Mesorhizobium]|uniref:helix-turn-helix domain-containing protein n=1 Tax=unclassified Mesorhizobium TaxID=325217 RepID=UPI00112E73E3|nr:MULTISPECIES: helix-turn-helix transcriptional regulator [unclassified Mesorhizobium]MBZ9921866.1 helix-turn-helix transcriptional regulator [Mesorhizobium sp. BR1-1-7]MBZ9954905.1 helix-turn-helix transcriptional regulator [Mesorhizobium sp. BR1-1-15]MBZ9970894.1 helix-turn-helix transcriptional regulator [Mesorhizobium sp. BR1-1-12]TPI56377.1 helix-turn-helix transcriptional regulator [Mesorhizobium sp. B3-1-1]TPJ60801.1 helix-turn-helix transcriptional regulator [Mesorhizobium sp. B2-6-1
MPYSAKREPLPELVASEAGQGHSALRTIRETKGYSVEELSLTTGLSVDEIEDIENGRTADPSQLRRIASALRLPQEALLGTAVQARAAQDRPAL